MKMYNQVKKKVKSSFGETLTETLVSVFIISLMSVGFLSMIMTANHMNEKAKEYDEAVDAAEVELAKKAGNKSTTEVSFQLNGIKTISFPVKIETVTENKGNASVTLYSYEYEVDEAEE